MQIVVGPLAAAALDAAPEDNRALVFAALFAMAFLAQLFSATALAMVPEPMMPPAPARPARLLQLLQAPLRDPKFRPLIRFNASWQFAVNLAQPFFTVFILQQLSLGITLAMALTVVSQVANGWALKRWGPLADRYGAKSVLNVAAPTFILCIAAMIGAAQIGPRGLVIAYLVLVHVGMGVAAAGVSLASGAIALKLSPEGAAAPYLSANALVSSAIGGLAPMVGGFCAEFFAARHFRVALEWRGSLINGELLSLSLTGWTFYFAFSALLGLLAVHRLAAVLEAGSLDRRGMMREILVLGQARFARPPRGGGADAPEDLAADLLGDPGPRA
jgi:MFS family permease